METQDLPELNDDALLPSDEVFGGLFTSKLRSALLEEFISDPYHVYTPKELAELLDTTYPTLRTHLKDLVGTGLIIKDEMDPTRPKYQVNFESRRLVALSLLMDSINDDRDGTDTMDRAIVNYFRDHLKKEYKDPDGDLKLKYIRINDIESMKVSSMSEEYPLRTSRGSA